MEEMSKKKVEVWGRTFEIDVIFRCYRGEVIDEIQIQAYKEFMEHWDEHMDEAYRAFEKYCAEEYSEEIGGDKFDNIFRFLIPRLIYVQKAYDHSKMVGFECYFKPDLENNLAAKFVNGKIVEVGGEQIIG